MSQTWTLDDVSPRAVDAPYTFYLPSKELLAQLQAGDIVKLIFYAMCRTRMIGQPNACGSRLLLDAVMSLKAS